MKKKSLLVAIAVGFLGLVAPLIVSTPVLADLNKVAQDCGCNSGNHWVPTKNTTKCITQCSICKTDPDGCEGGDLNTIVKDVVKILLFIIGAVSVVMIIVGGVRYVLSAGNPEAVKGAKNTILYAVVGLVIAILAYAIVNFVLGNF